MVSKMEKLRFVAEWFDAEREEIRPFTLTYYLDGTYEMFDRKNRFTFLRRGACECFELVDLVIGNTITIQRKQFKIKEYADQTSKGLHQHLAQNSDKLYAAMKGGSSSSAAKSYISALEAKIIDQIEFYFNDYNLEKNKHLQKLIKLEDGWIPLERLIKLYRLRMLSTDFQVIITALKKAPNQLMEISKDGAKVRRRPSKALPERDVDTRTVYVKRFPGNTTVDELRAFFKDKGNVSDICLMQDLKRKAIKGSAYISFPSKHDALLFMRAESIKYSGFELHREWKKDYVERKLKEDCTKKKQRQEEYERKKREDALMNLHKMFIDINRKRAVRKREQEQKEKREEEAKKQKEGPMRNATDTKGERDVLRESNREGKPGEGVAAEEAGSFDVSKASEAVEGGGKSESADISENRLKLVIQGEEVVTMAVEGEEELQYWKNFLACKRKSSPKQQAADKTAKQIKMDFD